MGRTSDTTNLPLQEPYAAAGNLSAAHTWHAMDSAAVLAAVESDGHGLTTSAAQARFRVIGPNVLPSAASDPFWRIFLRQFKSPLIYILLFAAATAVAIGEITDAGFIGAVLVLNAIIGGVQEWRADRSSRALQRLLRMDASVVRDGQVCEIDGQEIVPGDVVWLEAGDRVPADMRLLMTNGLEVNESLLTGESLPVDKEAMWNGQEQTPLADRDNMAHAGSTVARGRAKGVVVATGTATHVGKLAIDVMAAEPGKPPLLVRLERFTKFIGLAVGAACIAVMAVGVVGYNKGIAEMFMFGVALAVSAIPEGLPVAITVTLAIATTRMARRGVIVRKLGAVEGLGSCTLIASDKTGTLTCNELTVRKVHTSDGHDYQVSGEGFEPSGEVSEAGRSIDPVEHMRLASLVRAAVLCNEADLRHHQGHWSWRGDPTDIALLSLGVKLGIHREAELEAHPKAGEIPFEPELRFSATYHRVHDRTRIFVKGAPERVLEMCIADQATIEQLATAAHAMADTGCRVLAVAEGDAHWSDEKAVPPQPSGLKPLGLVGMIDPLRPGAREAVESCHNAGIRVVMITGDHPVTARAIARDLGFTGAMDAVVTGNDIEAADAQKLNDLVKDCRVFARIAPHQKLLIVEAAQSLGHFVAVTGDGVNDAPALRKSNIGVAMGNAGTDVAREAADMVITDDNFTTIVAGIEEGRIAFANIRNVIYLLISTGAAEVVLVGLVVATGMPLPLLPVQLLWLNLVTNGIQDVALAFEPGHGDALRRPPRPPRERILNRLMTERTVIAALVMGLVGFAAFAWMLKSGWSEPAARNAVLLLMVLFENVHIGNCRSETVSAFRLSPFQAPVLLIGVLAALSIHVLAMHTGWGAAVLETQPVSLPTWAALLGLALTVFVGMELHKWVWAKRDSRAVSPQSFRAA